MTGLLATLVLLTLARLATSQSNATNAQPAKIALPLATSEATATAVILPTADAATTIPTGESPPEVQGILSPPNLKSPPPTSPLPPPPPPGAGSRKTAVLSVIDMSGSGIQTYNDTTGDKFITAMAQIYGLGTSSIVIKDWGTTGRRLLGNSVTVASAGLFSDGISAASGITALNAAALSGALQAALQAAGLDVESVTLSSAVTAVPTNFQPISNGAASSGLHRWAIVVIVVAGTLVLLTIAFCCCSSCLCCCWRNREEEGQEEKLPRMFKFGSRKDRTPHFHSSQRFTQTSAHRSEKVQLGQPAKPKMASLDPVELEEVPI